MIAKPPTSYNALCDLVLVESERHELLQAYDRQRTVGTYPPLCVQLFIHNIRNGAHVTVYTSHAAVIMQFAKDQKIEWLESQIVESYRDLRRKHKSH